MICEKCGKSNKDNAKTCANCKEPLPKKSGCGGFKDILSFENKSPAGNGESNGADTSSLRAANNRNMIISAAALGLSVVVLVVSIVTAVKMPNAKTFEKASENKIKELQTQLDASNNKITELEKLVKNPSVAASVNSAKETEVKTQAQDVELQTEITYHKNAMDLATKDLNGVLDIDT